MRGCSSSAGGLTSSIATGRGQGALRSTCAGSPLQMFFLEHDAVICETCIRAGVCIPGSCRTSGSVRRGRYRSDPREQAGRCWWVMRARAAGSGSGLAIVSSSSSSRLPRSYVSASGLNHGNVDPPLRACDHSLNSHGPARRVVRTVGEAVVRAGSSPAAESSMTVSWSAAVALDGEAAGPTSPAPAAHAAAGPPSAATGRRSIARSPRRTK